MCLFFFFKQKTAYEMRISDWSSDVCSSDLIVEARHAIGPAYADQIAFDRRHRARLFGRRIYPGEFADLGCHVAGLCFRRIETSPAPPFAPYGAVRAEGAARILCPAPHAIGRASFTEIVCHYV